MTFRFTFVIIFPLIWTIITYFWLQFFETFCVRLLSSYVSRSVLAFVQSLVLFPFANETRLRDGKTRGFCSLRDEHVIFLRRTWWSSIPNGMSDLHCQGFTSEWWYTGSSYAAWCLSNNFVDVIKMLSIITYTKINSITVVYYHFLDFALLSFRCQNLCNWYSSSYK